jgi:quinol monooxygenase YgiN
VSVVVVVALAAHDGKVDEARRVILKSREPCLTRDGCTGFEVLHSRQDECHFVFVERWRSVEERKSFLSSLMRNSEFVESIKVFVADPAVEYFDLD